MRAMAPRRLLPVLAALGLLACRASSVPTDMPDRTAATAPAVAPAQGPAPEVGAGRFTVIVLGAQGGIVEGDLSAYLVAAPGRAEFVCLDAGTLYTGLVRAAARGAFATDEPPGRLLRERVRAYLLSHPHLDHLAGLILASPEDAPGKPILGLPPTLDALRAHLFNGTVWANFGDSGPPPPIGRYTLTPLTPGEPRALAGTDLSVEAWPLSHAGGVSTAFLLQAPDGAALLYLGDTGPDAVERSDALDRLWRRVAPLVRAGSLRAIFLEVSFPDPRPDAQLFGHLTPKWLRAELASLAAHVAPQDAAALRGVTVLVTHIKPDTTGGDARAAIQQQLGGEVSGARLVFPAQGDRFGL